MCAQSAATEYQRRFGYNEYTIGKCPNCGEKVLVYFNGRALQRFGHCPSCSCNLVSGIPLQGVAQLTKIEYQEASFPPVEMLQGVVTS